MNTVGMDNPPVSSEAQDGCDADLPPQAIEGIRDFNEQRFFEAHEALEAAWRHETRPVRRLYQGILEVAVAYYHVQRGNYAGAMKVFARAQRWLAQLPEVCSGVDVARLRADAASAETALGELGPKRIEAFDPWNFKAVPFVSSTGGRDSPTPTLGHSPIESADRGE